MGGTLTLSNHLEGLIIMTTTTTTTTTRTPEILGYVWEIQDIRSWSGNSYIVEFARVTPLDPVTLEPVTSVKVGRVVRDATYGHVTFTASFFAHHAHISPSLSIDGYASEPLTDNARGILEGALVDYLRPFAKVLTREEVFGQYLAEMGRWLPSEIGQTIGQRTGHNSPNWEDRTPGELEQIRGAVLEALDSVRERVLAGEFIR